MALKEMPKVGEKVRYVGVEYSFLTVGKSYEVTRVEEETFFYVDDHGGELCDNYHDFADWDLVTESHPDSVNSPSHYTQGNIEVIDFIDQVADGYVGRQAAYAGNVIKYVSRAPYKNQAQDIRKAIWYAQRLADVMEVEADE